VISRLTIPTELGICSSSSERLSRLKQQGPPQPSLCLAWQWQRPLVVGFLRVLREYCEPILLTREVMRRIMDVFEFSREANGKSGQTVLDRLSRLRCLHIGHAGKVK
jgi:hypothetical protein